MIEVYLFDWGNTLMVNHPNMPGKMCDWPQVDTISGAQETLATLSQTADIYVATSAVDSCEIEVQQAFERVGLNQYIRGYFCKANIGAIKTDPDFLDLILARLNKPANKVAMVGDSIIKDIQPALVAGILPIWLTEDNQEITGVRKIANLQQLLLANTVKDEVK